MGWIVGILAGLFLAGKAVSAKAQAASNGTIIIGENPRFGGGLVSERPAPWAAGFPVNSGFTLGFAPQTRELTAGGGDGGGGDTQGSIPTGSESPDAGGFEGPGSGGAEGGELLFQ